MEITIKKLTPDGLSDFLYFFENVAHTDNKEWDRCYCLNYCSDDQYKIPGYAEFDAERRREYAIDYVKKGMIRGYLAYADGNVVAWCNVNEKNSCRKCFGNYFLYGEEEEPAEEKNRVLSVFCFTVAPAYRGKHIATLLLERVISDAKNEGYDYLEAYPEKGEVDQFYNYCGPKGLYEKAGFVFYKETQKRNIVRKALQMDTQKELTFRFAQRQDCELILYFIKELARYEKMEDQVVATPQLLEEWIFDKKKAEVIFVSDGEKEVGFALFFHNFSTFLGRAGIYLEDLYVLPEYRGRGYGKALLFKLKEIAVERKCGRLEWWCLDWNQPSIDFYLSMGATPMKDWTVYRIDGENLK